MASHDAVADIQSESFPGYQTKLQDSYIEGYDPVSLAAPHSSLAQYSTWVAMGLILASLFGFGIMVWGIGSRFYGWGAQSENYSNALMLLGAIEMAVTLALGFLLIARGRKGYKEYRRTTGRRN